VGRAADCNYREIAARVLGLVSGQETGWGEVVAWVVGRAAGCDYGEIAVRGLGIVSDLLGLTQWTWHRHLLLRR
jgi:hypothetical protein